MDSKPQAPVKSFCEIIEKLKSMWSNYGCAIIEPYTLEVGAGTLHPETIFRSISSKNEKIAYVQPSIRPKDACNGKNPNRLYQHHQFQVIIKPSGPDLLDKYWETLKELGISTKTHDLNLLEDDWENPSVGAWGLGWEVSCNGMEITQITYIQQIGGVDCKIIPAEITYGLERLALQIFNVDSIYNVPWNESLTYGDLFMENEEAMSHAAKDKLPFAKEMLRNQFDQHMKMAGCLPPKAAYHYCLKAIHCLNMLDSAGGISPKEKTRLIATTREFTGKCCNQWLANENKDKTKA